MSKKSILFGLSVVLIFGNACYYDKEELLYPSAGNNCQGVAAKFTQVNSIIQSKCAISGCHDAASTNSGGPFLNYSQIKNHAFNIKIQVQTGLMPQSGSLTPAELKSIVCWVDSGAPNN